MTAKQRRELAALRQRMADMLRGRVGNAWKHMESVAIGAEEGPHLLDEMGLEEFCDWVTALGLAFSASNGRDPEEGRVCPIYFARYNLHRLSPTLDEAARWLYENGARADAGEIADA